MKPPDDTEPTEAVASWLAGHAQAMEGGDRIPAPSIKDIANWYLGYDVGTIDRQENKPIDTSPERAGPSH